MSDRAETTVKWSDLLPEFCTITSRVESVLGLTGLRHRLECILSTRSAPRLVIHLAAPLDAKNCSALLSAFSIPAPGSHVLDALVRKVPRNRDTVYIGADGSVGLALAPATATSRILEVAEALGCDQKAPLFRHLDELNRPLSGLSCNVSPAGPIAFCVYAHVGRDRMLVSSEWQALARRLGAAAISAPLDRLLEHARASEPAVTFCIELLGENGPAASCEVPDVPIACADEALTLDAGEQSVFARAFDIVDSLGQRTFRTVEIRQPEGAKREIRFQIDLAFAFNADEAITAASARSGVIRRLDGGLLDGVRVILPTESDSQRATRLLVSEGTAAPPLFEADGPPYRPEAIVPRLPWRIPTAAERALLIQQTFTSRTEGCVAVVRLDPTVLDLFNGLGLDDVETLQQVEAVRQNPKTQRALLDVAKILGEAYSTVGSKFTCLGISAYKPGQRTVSYDHRIQRRVGLHLDTWDDANLDARALSRNVLLINLGRSDRYFLYVNVSLSAMGALLSDTIADANLLAETFMRRLPGYSVVKVRVAPGEAYVAPVQGVIHDGCTDGSQHMDIHAVYLGSFRAPGPPH